MRTEDYTCQHCGKECTRQMARGQKPKWCSQQCADLGKKAKAGTCQLCGAEFFGHGSKFCSRTCSALFGNSLRPKSAKPRQPSKPRPEPRPKFCRIFATQCSMCGDWFTSRHTISTCSDECRAAKVTADRAHARHRRRALVRDQYAEPTHWRKIYKRDGPSCYLCGYDTDPTDFRLVAGSDGRPAFIAGLEYPTLDHVIAISKGGAHDMGNARLAHLYCNAIKSDRDLMHVA